MQIPLQVTFRHMEASPTLEAKIRERVSELDQFHDRIMGCRVVVEQESRHHVQGNQYHVRADLTVPGHELVAGRESPKHQAYEDPYVAVRDAFDSLRRQIEDVRRRERHDVKHHEPQPVGRITALNRREGCGTITTADERELYFHRNSVVGHSYDTLAVGMEVRFAEELGEKGAQASTVHVLGKRHAD